MKTIKSKVNKMQLGLFLLLTYLVPGSIHAQNTAVPFKNPLQGNDNLFSLIYAVLGFVTQVGAAVVVFMVIYSGLQFVLAQGDPEKLKKARSTFTWTIIGGVVLLGAAALAEVVCNTAVSLGARGVNCRMR